MQQTQLLTLQALGNEFRAKPDPEERTVPGGEGNIESIPRNRVFPEREGREPEHI